MASQDSQPFHWHYTGLDDQSYHFHGRAILLVVILVSLLILFALLCLYARWVCRYRRRPVTNAAPDPSVSSTRIARNRADDDAERAAPAAVSPTGLDPLSINSFPTVLHRTCSGSTDDPAQCSICLCAFVEEEKVKVLPDCNHTYHPECVDKWLATRSSCPLCRASLRVDSAVP